MFSGIDALTLDSQRFAMDYHIIGFRECISEVARYLMNVEGMDAQDPLRIRLMSHLQCFAAQIDISTKSSNTSASFSQTPYQPSYTIPYHQNYSTHSTGVNNYINNLPPTHTCERIATSILSNHSGAHTLTVPNSAVSQTPENEPQQHNSHQNVHHETQQHQEHLQYSNSLESHPDLTGPTYTDISTNTQRNASTSTGNIYSNPQYILPSSSYGNAVYTGSKPYRPWGAEMAY